MQRYASLRQGLVGCWCPSVSGPFGYRLPDLSGYGNHGTLTNMDPGTDWVTSGGKGAIDFDGSNDHVIGSDTQNLRIRFGTITGWFSTGTSSALKALFCTYSENPKVSGISLGINIGTIGTGKIGVVVGKATGTNSGDFGLWYGADRVDDSRLHSFACAIYSDGNVQFYIDGLATTTSLAYGTKVSPVYSATNYITIAAEQTGAGIGKYWTGQLDDIRIYNRALSESEIRLLASGRGVGLIPERNARRYYQPPQQPRNRSSRFLSFPC